jgi:hypothetical protein
MLSSISQFVGYSRYENGVKEAEETMLGFGSAEGYVVKREGALFAIWPGEMREAVQKVAG